jgi:hypothetical protein
VSKSACTAVQNLLILVEVTRKQAFRSLHGWARQIVDCWAGVADPGRLVDGDTLFNVFSVTAVTATRRIQAERDLSIMMRRYDTGLVPLKAKQHYQHVLSHIRCIQNAPEVTPERLDWDWIVKPSDAAFSAGGSSIRDVLRWLVGEITAGPTL